MSSATALFSTFEEVLEEHAPEPGLLVDRCRCGSDWSAQHVAGKLLNAYRAAGAPPVTEDRPGRHHGGATEHAAATTIRTGTQRAAVLLAIDVAGDYGRTDYELERNLGLKRPSPGNRRGELVDAGLVEDSGRTRPTDTGHAAVVWVATEQGRAKALELRIAD